MYHFIDVIIYSTTSGVILKLNLVFVNTCHQAWVCREALNNMWVWGDLNTMHDCQPEKLRFSPGLENENIFLYFDFGFGFGYW